MSGNDDQRWLTARHEAGYAVATFHYDCPFFMSQSCQKESRWALLESPNRKCHKTPLCSSAVQWPNEIGRSFDPATTSRSPRSEAITQDSSLFRCDLAISGGGTGKHF